MAQEPIGLGSAGWQTPSFRRPRSSGHNSCPVADILEGDCDKETLVGLDIVTLGYLVQDKTTVDGYAREWLSNKDLNAVGLKDIIPVDVPSP